MMIKLSTVDVSEPLELWLNTSAISSVIQPTKNERDVGAGAKVYITGKAFPWFVAESVRKVINLIEGVE